ncbi:hypothetical protein BJX70DRAFT_395194 [Aspergillus crustosus]
MAPYLPHEILQIIADDLQSTGAPLTQCVLITTGLGVTRRPGIRHPKSKAVVPHFLLDYTTIRDGGFTLDSPIRQANNAAFQTGMMRLFTVLSSWSSNVNIALEIHNHGDELCEEEPDTIEVGDAREFDFETQNGDRVIPPYRATDHDDSTIDLPKTACIKRLSFS